MGTPWDGDARMRRARWYGVRYRVSLPARLRRIRDLSFFLGEGEVHGDRRAVGTTFSVPQRPAGDGLAAPRRDGNLTYVAYLSQRRTAAVCHHLSLPHRAPFRRFVVCRIFAPDFHTPRMAQRRRREHAKRFTWNNAQRTPLHSSWLKRFQLYNSNASSTQRCAASPLAVCYNVTHGGDAQRNSPHINKRRRSGGTRSGPRRILE
jgi:hypothetical protein